MAEKRLLGMADIQKITSLSRATIYRYIKVGEFPKQVTLGPRRVGWRETEVLNWIARREPADGKKVDHFSVVAQKLADGTLKGEIILNGRRRLRMLRTDERLVIERKEPPGKIDPPDDD